MATNSASNTMTTQLDSGVPNFDIGSETIDEGSGEKEYYYYNTNWPELLSYFKNMPEVYQNVTSLNMWAFGKGFTADTRTKVILEHITGWGEDTFDSIIINQGNVEDVNGDAYAEIIRDKETGVLINLKPLNPYRVRHVIGKDGLIIRYDVWQNGKWEKMKKEDIFHTCRGRIANEGHGTSKIWSSKWMLDAKKEAMEDWRRISHRSTIRILYIDIEDTAQNNTIREQYKEAIKNGEVMILPLKRGDAELVDATSPPIQQFLEWIRYIDSALQKSLGVPDAILGGTQVVGEANSKIGYLTFEVPYGFKAKQMEQDLWNQMQIKVEFEKPRSLMDMGEEADNSNSGQIGFQQNELRTSIGRTE